MKRSRRARHASPKFRRRGEFRSCRSRTTARAGEELVGAKQNRIVNLTILVPAAMPLTIPVSCVEAGRWSHQSEAFSSVPRAHYASGRAGKMAQVTASLVQAGSRRSDQMAIWNDIAEKSERLAVSSATSAAEAMYVSHSDRLEEAAAALAPVDTQRGAVFAIDQRIVGLELFDRADTFRKLLPKIVQSYALDSIDLAAQAERSPRAGSDLTSRAGVENYLRRAGEAAIKEFPALGLGKDLRLVTPELSGGALGLDDVVVQFSAFTTA
jgi:ARG and Rhodanese-Phosphatase-superfamily-associated Protein domain